MSEGTTPTRRLIEEAFPLKKVSEDSKHEKNVNHGHIATLHPWAARRPLAAARATVIAALLPDPGDEYRRDQLCKRIEKVTPWSEENWSELAKLREEIRSAYGGRPPRVLDMFAGGGAIPFEAMRLGCDVTAIDYNPVAWLLLRCTLEYPQRFAGKTWAIPPELEKYLEPTENTNKSAGKRGKNGNIVNRATPASTPPWMAGQSRMSTLADHVRAWGSWVLDHARQELEPFYPAVEDKTPLTYLWARTVPCPDPNCGTEIPLLKTLWLSKEAGNRVALRIMTEGATGPVRLEVWKPKLNENIGVPIMASAKATCPRCGTQIPTEYLRQQGQMGRMGVQMTVVVTEGPEGKIYRTPTPIDLEAVKAAAMRLPDAEARILLGRPREPISPAYLSSRHQAAIVVGYGLDRFDKIFTERTMLTLLTFVHWTQQASVAMAQAGYDFMLSEAIRTYLALVIDRVADYGSTLTSWIPSLQAIGHTFASFRLAMNWDFSEANSTVMSAGSYPSQLERAARSLEFILRAPGDQPPDVRYGSAIDLLEQEKYDAIITDPPYYDAVPYADIADFFYVWLRRSLDGQGGSAFENEVIPKRGELVQNAGLFNKDEQAARRNYEAGMAQAFARARQVVRPDGIMVIVFAHKDVQAWETLVSAMIEAGWTVTASWPIDTEKTNRTRARNSAALASSIWLVCRKRPEEAGIGRYGDVMRRMQERITERLRYFWDQGISGPDFIWAAVGPALESYSSFREVRRLDGSRFTVGEFLRESRRMVTDFALGKILHGASTGTLDETTRYYLMHRHSFGFGPAPMGEGILLAGGYGLNLDDLRGQRGILIKGSAAKKTIPVEESDGDELGEEGEAEPKKMSGNDLRLLTFEERARVGLGEPLPSGSLPMIDMLHRLLVLWSGGQLEAVADYATAHGLGPENEAFWAMAQSILEMSDPKTRERTLLEALVAWGRKRSVPEPAQPTLFGQQSD